MKYVTTVVVGAGQCGLAMSRALTQRSVDHVVLERGHIGNSWRTERWDSLHLLTPNWMSTPAGHPYRGPEPDGFMPCTSFAASLERAALRDAAPVSQETRVLSLRALAGGYRLETDQGAIDSASVVVATGECARPRIPSFADAVPPGVVQVTPHSYKRPGDVPCGTGVLVVGASASGLQIARELAMAGRQVTLAVGNHLRLPRRYRGADILWWMDRIGALDVPFEVTDATRLRRLPSLPLAGHPANADLDLNSLQSMGVIIVGRLSAITDGVAWFSGGLANACATADLKLVRLLDRIDAYAAEHGLDAVPARRPDATRVAGMADHRHARRRLCSLGRWRHRTSAHRQALLQRRPRRCLRLHGC